MSPLSYYFIHGGNRSDERSCSDERSNRKWHNLRYTVITASSPGPDWHCSFWCRVKKKTKLKSALELESSRGWSVHSVSVSDDSHLHSISLTPTIQQNTFTLDQPPPGCRSFRRTFHFSLAKVSQECVQVPAIGGSVQRALSHHAQRHAQSGPDVVRHHGRRGAPWRPHRSAPITGSLAL